MGLPSLQSGIVVEVLQMLPLASYNIALFSWDLEMGILSDSFIFLSFGSNFIGQNFLMVYIYQLIFANFGFFK